MRVPGAQRVLKKIQRTMRDAPVEMFVRKPGHHYVPDYYGRSAHKQTDITLAPQFGELARRAVESKRTLLYYDRLHTIYQCLRDLSRRFDTSGLHASEIGVYRGGTSMFIIETLAALGVSRAALDCFDTFEGHSDLDLRVGVDDLNVHTSSTFKVDGIYQSVVEMLRPYPDVRVHKGRVQEKWNELPHRLHFVHLDVDLYEPTAFVLQQLDGVLEPGGFVVVDDYGFITCEGAKRAVDEYLREARAYSFMPLLTGQCVLVKNG